MVALDSGDIMLTFELQGRAFETADVRDLNDWHTKLNGCSATFTTNGCRSGRI
jgi:type IV secretion system protein VirB4